MSITFCCFVLLGTIRKFDTSIHLQSGEGVSNLSSCLGLKVAEFGLSWMFRTESHKSFTYGCA